MHIQTHLLSGWCFGNLFCINNRERFFCILAAVLPDLDGIGAILGQEQYWDYHHILGHNLFAGLLFSGILTVFSMHRVKAFLLYIGLFHLHVLMDFFGIWTEMDD